MIQEMQSVIKEEVRAAVKGMESGSACGPDGKPVQVWRYLAERESSGVFDLTVEYNHGVPTRTNVLI